MRSVNFFSLSQMFLCVPTGNVIFNIQSSVLSGNIGQLETVYESLDPSQHTIACLAVIVARYLSFNSNSLLKDTFIIIQNSFCVNTQLPSSIWYSDDFLSPRLQGHNIENWDVTLASIDTLIAQSNEGQMRWILFFPYNRLSYWLLYVASCLVDY